MNEFGKSVRVLIVAICLALFSLGILWNLFYGTLPDAGPAAPTLGEAEQVHDAESGVESMNTAALEQQYTQEQMQAAEAGVFDLEPVKSANEPVNTATNPTANQIAALRMERERSWQQLQSGLEALDFADKQQCLKQYEELRYREQRLELLLKAKGVADCLVLLEEQQANVIVDGEAAAQQYEKIYDLVQRNTVYLPEQIIVIPLPQIATAE